MTCIQSTKFTVTRRATVIGTYQMTRMFPTALVHFFSSFFGIFPFKRVSFKILSCLHTTVMATHNGYQNRGTNHTGVSIAGHAAEVLLRFEPQQRSTLTIFLFIPRKPRQFGAPHWHFTSGPNCTNLRSQKKRKKSKKC